MYNHLSTKTAKRLAITPIGKAICFALFGLLFLTAANVNVCGQAVDSFNPNASNVVTCIALQPDGKVLVGGAFVNVGGVYRPSLARLNADGTLDTTFKPILHWVRDIVVQPDGKILIAGDFSKVYTEGDPPPGPAENNRNGFARLNSNGTLDTAFDSNYNPTLDTGILFLQGNSIHNIALQPDGKMLISGGFYYRSNGQQHQGLARMNSNGTIDTTFSPQSYNVGNNGSLYVVTLQSSGKILVGGGFKSVNGEVRQSLARLNNDGTLDTAFVPPLTSPDNSNNDVRSITLQPDGKILVGGNFAINGNPSTISTHFIRLNTNGGLDTTFNPNINNFSNAPVVTAVVQTNGKILIGGSFEYQDGQQFRRGFQRLTADGTTDTSFNPNSNNYGNEIVIQPDGKVLVGGSFTNIGGQSRNHLARFLGDTITSSRRSFDFDGDGKADVSVFRPSNGAWYLNQSSAGFAGIGFGISTDRIVPADYDGDGKTDVAVYRSGIWYLLRSQLGFTNIQFGTADDVPIPADFDGDGKADVAVFRASNNTWYRLSSSDGNFAFEAFGISGDVPVPADYDGDGRANVAVFRASNNTWYTSTNPAINYGAVPFGQNGDKLAPADFDGDGKTDVAVFRPSNGAWYLNRSRDGFVGVQFGQNGDLPAAADYDGDGKADIAVYRGGTWYLNRSQAGFVGIAFGAGGDQPAPNAFVR